MPAHPPTGERDGTKWRQGLKRWIPTAPLRHRLSPMQLDTLASLLRARLPLPSVSLSGKVATVAISLSICVNFFPGESAIGRDGECVVCIPVPALSRRHAILLSEEGEHFISDLDSRNCTFRGGVSGRGFVAIVSPRCLGYHGYNKRKHLILHSLSHCVYI